MEYKSESMNLVIRDATAYLTFKRLQEYQFVTHAFSTRLGGVSEEPFKSMNLSYKRGDLQENVNKNYEIFCNAVGVDTDSLVVPSLVHGDSVGVVKRENRGSGIRRKSDFADTDALITNQAGVTVVTSHADCVPIFMLDPNKRAVGTVHAGWRGTVKKIALKTVEKFKSEFGSNAKDIICCLGPAINRCCFEVDSEVARQFQTCNFADATKIIFSEGGKVFVDLLEANKQTLMEVGVLERNIVLSDICTSCNKDMLFSHRVMGEKRGAMLALIGIL